MHARQAISRNAQILDGHIRIGVVPCTDKEIIGDIANRPLVNVVETIAEEQNEADRSFIPAVTPKNNENMLDTSLNVSRLSMASRTGMRSLAAAYDTSNNDVSMDRGQHPSKDGGLMNKLWHFMGSS